MTAMKNKTNLPEGDHQCSWQPPDASRSMKCLDGPQKGMTSWAFHPDKLSCSILITNHWSALLHQHHLAQEIQFLN
jgi:hypothetical protein